MSDHPESMERQPEPAKSRSYRHDKCGTETLVDGADYYVLSDPFCIALSQTYCFGCKAMVKLNSVSWVDTGENIQGYRQRLRAAASTRTKLWRLVVIPLLGAVVLFLVVLRAIGLQQLNVLTTLVVLGLGIFWASAMSRIVTRLGLRQRQWDNR